MKFIHECRDYGNVWSIGFEVDGKKIGGDFALDDEPNTIGNLFREVGTMLKFNRAGWLSTKGALARHSEPIHKGGN